VLSGRGLCDELITHPEESYQLCCVVVCDLETSRIGAPYIYDISSLRVKVKHIVLYIICASSHFKCVFAVLAFPISKVFVYRLVEFSCIVYSLLNFFV